MAPAKKKGQDSAKKQAQAGSSPSWAGSSPRSARSMKAVVQKEKGPSDKFGSSEVKDLNQKTRSGKSWNQNLPSAVDKAAPESSEQEKVEDSFSSPQADSSPSPQADSSSSPQADSSGQKEPAELSEKKRKTDGADLEDNNDAKKRKSDAEDTMTQDESNSENEIINLEAADKERSTCVKNVPDEAMECFVDDQPEEIGLDMSAEGDMVDIKEENADSEEDDTNNVCSVSFTASLPQLPPACSNQSRFENVALVDPADIKQENAGFDALENALRSSIDPSINAGVEIKEEVPDDFEVVAEWSSLTSGSSGDRQQPEKATPASMSSTNDESGSNSNQASVDGDDDGNCVVSHNASSCSQSEPRIITSTDPRSLLRASISPQPTKDVQITSTSFGFPLKSLLKTTLPPFLAQTKSSSTNSNPVVRSLLNKNSTETSTSKTPSDSLLYTIKSSKEAEQVQNSSSQNLSSSDEDFIPDKVIRPKQRASKVCPVPGCDGNGHITGLYPNHRSVSGCPRRSAALSEMLTRSYGVRPDFNKCPVKGCDGKGHVNNHRVSHRSESGCPLAAMNRLMSQKSPMHVVVLPNADDPSKAMITACSEKDLIKLAAKQLNRGTDRVLRPMILTKQLEPRDANAAPQTTPRENLAKELEKYNRPETTVTAPVPVKQEPSIKEEPADPSMDLQPEGENPEESVVSTTSFKHAPERPNILSKFPHMRHKPNMLRRSNKFKMSSYNANRSSPSSTCSSSSVSSGQENPGRPLVSQTLSSLQVNNG